MNVIRPVSYTYIYDGREGVARTAKTRFHRGSLKYGSGHWDCKFDPGCKFDPNPDLTLHAQVCKFGHQWKYGKFRNYAIMQSRKFTGFR